jgi:hypothetical protein
MNDLVQQLLNPVIHKPDGGRLITQWDSEAHNRNTERKEFPRNPRTYRGRVVINDIERFKRIYEMHRDGFSNPEIALAMNISRKSPAYAIQRYKQYLETGKGG